MTTILRCAACVFHFALSMVLMSASTAGEPTTIRFVPGYLPPSNSNGERKIAAVEVLGEITADAPERFRTALDEGIKKANMWHYGGAPMLPVYLDSLGGNVLAAMRMGQLIRQLGASTWIRPTAKCASSCVLIFAGGVERLLLDDAHLGIHRPYFPPEQFAKLDRLEAQKRYAALEAGVAKYLQSMGVADSLFNQMMQIPSNKLKWLEEYEAKEMRLVGEDPAFAEWDRARMQDRYIPEFVIWKDGFDDCIKKQSSEECLRQRPVSPRTAR
jgi:ATP-dependent protease ClpP protease subunit